MKTIHKSPVSVSPIRPLLCKLLTYLRWNLSIDSFNSQILLCLVLLIISVLSSSCRNEKLRHITAASVSTFRQVSNGLRFQVSQWDQRQETTQTFTPPGNTIVQNINMSANTAMFFQKQPPQFVTSVSDAFVQAPGFSKLDLLLVIDDSGSMLTEQALLGSHFSHFYDVIMASPYATQTCTIVTTTSWRGFNGVANIPLGGQKICSGPYAEWDRGTYAANELAIVGLPAGSLGRVVPSQEVADYINDIIPLQGASLTSCNLFRGNKLRICDLILRAGILGSGIEKHLPVTISYLKSYWQRADALQAVLTLTDEDNCSTGDVTGDNGSPLTEGADYAIPGLPGGSCPLQYNTIEALQYAVDTFAPNRFIFSGIIIPPAGTGGALQCAGNTGNVLAQAIALYGGTVANICEQNSTDWQAALQAIAARFVERRMTFPLSQSITGGITNPDSLIVIRDGIPFTDFTLIQNPDMSYSIYSEEGFPGGSYQISYNTGEPPIMSIPFTGPIVSNFIVFYGDIPAPGQPFVAQGSLGGLPGALPCWFTIEDISLTEHILHFLINSPNPSPACQDPNNHHPQPGKMYRISFRTDGSSITLNPNNPPANIPDAIRTVTCVAPSGSSFVTNYELRDLQILADFSNCTSVSVLYVPESSLVYNFFTQEPANASNIVSSILVDPALIGHRPPIIAEVLNAQGSWELAKDPVINFGPGVLNINTHVPGLSRIRYLSLSSIPPPHVFAIEAPALENSFSIHVGDLLLEQNTDYVFHQDTRNLEILTSLPVFGKITISYIEVRTPIVEFEIPSAMASVNRVTITTVDGFIYNIPESAYEVVHGSTTSVVRFIQETSIPPLGSSISISWW